MATAYSLSGFLPSTLSTLFAATSMRVTNIAICRQNSEKKTPARNLVGMAANSLSFIFYKATFQRLSFRPDGMRAPQSHSCLNLTASPSVRCSSGLALDPRNSRVPVSPSLHHFTSETGIRQEHFTGFSCLFLEPFSRAAAEGYFHSA